MGRKLSGGQEGASELRVCAHSAAERDGTSGLALSSFFLWENRPQFQLSSLFLESRRIHASLQ